jgi:hypothetical protein
VISLAGGGAIVLPQDGPRKWAFKLSPTEPISIGLVLDHMAKPPRASRSRRSASPRATAKGFLKALEAAAPAKGFKIVASEKYNQTDQSVTAQVLKIVAANPDAVYVFAAGTPGALPQLELANRGYKGLVYQTQGVANNDFLRVGGKSLEGTYMTVAPVLVAEQLPESNPTRRPAVDFVNRFEKAHGAGSRSLFAATAWDALLIVQQASREAMKKAKPGTPEFRAALRDAIENLKDFVGSEGVYNMSAADHNGVDARSQVMVKIENGGWKLQPSRTGCRAAVECGCELGVAPRLRRLGNRDRFVERRRAARLDRVMVQLAARAQQPAELARVSRVAKQGLAVGEHRCGTLPRARSRQHGSSRRRGALRRRSPTSLARSRASCRACLGLVSKPSSRSSTPRLPTTTHMCGRAPISRSSASERSNSSRALATDLARTARLPCAAKAIASVRRVAASPANAT